MAKLSAHGDEVGRIVYTTCTKAYMSDGKVLKNYGDGWKLYSRIKPDFTPASAYASSRAALDRWEHANPAGLAYKKELHALAGQGKRLKLHTAVQLMPDDADGAPPVGYTSRTGAKRQQYHAAGIALREIGKRKRISTCRIIEEVPA